MDQFLDYFLPKLAKIAPEQSALIESIAAGYKICHPDELDGITLESVETGVGVATSSHPNSAMLQCRYPWPPLEVSSEALPRLSKEWRHHIPNIVMESKRVNRKHFIADSKNKVKDIHSVIHTSARRLTDNIDHILNDSKQTDIAKQYLSEMETASLADLYGTLFNVLYYAITGNTREEDSYTKKPRTTIKSVYIYVTQEDKSTTEIRLSDHATIVAKKYITNKQGEKVLAHPADRHIGINLNDESTSELMRTKDRAASDLINTTDLDIVEVKFHLESMSGISAEKRVTFTKLILTAIENIVSKSAQSNAATSLSEALKPLIDGGVCEIQTGKQES